MCELHTLAHSPWETHSDNQDQPSFQLEGDALQPLMSCLDPWTNCDLVIYLQITCGLDLSCNS